MVIPYNEYKRAYCMIITDKGKYESVLKYWMRAFSEANLSKSSSIILIMISFHNGQDTINLLEAIMLFTNLFYRFHIANIYQSSVVETHQGTPFVAPARCGK